MKSIVCRKKQSQHKRGIGLFEVLTSIALRGFMTVVIFAALKLYRLIFDRNMDAINAQDNLKRVMQVVTRDLEEARQGIPSGACSAINSPAYVCIQSAALSFKVPESTTGGTLTYKTIKYTYDSAADTISRQEISSTGSYGTINVMGRQITAASFSGDSTTNIVSISFTGSSGTSVSSQVRLRNP